VKSLCPCSKEISDYGAHNQRGSVAIEVRSMRGHDGHPQLIWIEELVEIGNEPGGGGFDFQGEPAIEVKLAVVDGEATQHLSVDASKLSLDTMATLLGNFADNARIWRRVLDGTDAARASGAAPMGLRV
jgi:hypothetical protein